jgi:hypothetical protein
MVDTDRIMSKSLPGSPRLTVGEALSPALRAPFHGRSADQSIEDLGEYLTKDRLQGGRRFIVHGPGGVGKSLLAAHIVASATDVTTRGVLIDAVDARADMDEPTFGTSEWLRTKIRSSEGDHPVNTFFVVDSLDELFAVLSRTSVLSYLSHSGFCEASVLLCRTSFYDRFLRESNFARDRSVIELTGWSSGEALSQGIKYLEALSAGDAIVDRFQATYGASPVLQDLCLVPLRLCMVATTLAQTGHVSSGENGETDGEGLLNVYEEWIRSVLSVEAARLESVLSTGDKSHLLEALAWKNYDYREQDVATAYSVEEIEEWLGRNFGKWCGERGLNVSLVAQDLLNRTLLTVRETSEAVITDQFSFCHRTIEDLYVATFACHSLSGASSIAPSVVFRTYLGPDVWQFLQLMLLRVAQRDPYVARRMARRGVEALKVAVGEDLRNAESLENTVLREQLGHYIGHLGVADAQAYLYERLAAERDPWVRRGTIIGMGFGGDVAVCESYVDDLRGERTAGGDLPQNSVNRGTQLYFYGDQIPADDVHERDAGGPECARTANRLISQLLDRRRRPTWKLDLYSLLDIVLHRTVSGPEGRACLTRRRADLETIYAQMVADAEAKAWPDVAELRAIISVAL